MMRRWRRLCAAVLGSALALIMGCSGTEVVLVQGDEVTGRTTTLAIGQELDITLGTVGPGAYDSVPAISSSVIRFLDEAVVPPYVPAGPRQRFRFVAERAGEASITFHHSVSDAVITARVTVR